MKRLIVIASLAGLATFAGALAERASAAPAELKLPPETAALKPSSLAGYAIASRNCGICHSVDYVDYQPPRMTKTQWTAEMTKMQHVYGAPISDDEVKLLGIYLAQAYGDASTVSAEDKALEPAAAASIAASATDVQALLTANGCLACHAIDHLVVGPAYHDVANRYRTDPQAVAHVTATIQRGGSGQWGPVPMPPFPELGADDAKALAAYVLAQ